MNKKELLQLYKKICRRSSDSEVYANTNLWKENSADADYIYSMIRISDMIDILKERIGNKDESLAVIEGFERHLESFESQFAEKEQSEKFEEIKRKYL